MMIWCGNEDRIELLANLIEHPAVVGEHLDFFRVPIVFFQIPLHLGVLLFIWIDNGHDVVPGLFDDPFQVVHGTSAAANLDTIELISGSFCSWKMRAEEGRCGESGCAQCGVFEKRTASE